MKMKAQSKAIVASLVVVVLALCAVSGTTYSWFSDENKTTIDINSAKVQMDTTYQYSIDNITWNTMGETLSIDNYKPGDTYYFKVTYADNVSTIKTVHRLQASISGYADEAAGSKIILDGVAIGAIDSDSGRTKVQTITDWVLLEPRELPGLNNVTTFSLTSNANELVSQNFDLTITLNSELVQSEKMVSESRVVDGKASLKIFHNGIGVPISMSFTGLNADDAIVSATLVDNNNKVSTDDIVVRFSIESPTVTDVTFGSVDVSMVIDGDYRNSVPIYILDGADDDKGQPVIDDDYAVYDPSFDTTTINFITTHFSDYAIINLNVSDDDALRALVETINLNKGLWNRELVVNLEAGVYESPLEIKQYPNKTHDDNVEPTDADLTNIRFVGKDGVLIKSAINIHGFGWHNGGMEYFEKCNATTTFEGIEFIKNPIKMFTADDVIFNKCTFNDAEDRIVIGESGNTCGTVKFLESIVNVQLQGYVNNLIVENCTANIEGSRFINLQNGSASVTDSTIEVDCEEDQVFRTDNSGKITIANSKVIAPGMTVITLRGSNSTCVTIDSLSDWEYSVLATSEVDGAKMTVGDSTFTLYKGQVFENCYVEDDVVYYVDGTTGDVVLYDVSNYTEESFKIPDGVTTLSSKILDGNSIIEEVTVPVSVKDFGGKSYESGTGAYGGFFYKSSVKKVILPEGMETIPAATFNQASNLKEINIPSTVSSIGINAFAGAGLVEITLTDAVAEIGYGAFRDMSSLTTVTIEGDVYIPDYAFRNCEDLKHVYLNGIDVSFGSNMVFTISESNNESPNGITVHVKTQGVADRLNATGNFKGTIEVENYGDNGIYEDESGNKYTYASNGDDLKEALGDDVSIVYVGPGNYNTFSNLQFKANQTLVCSEGTVFSEKSGLNINGATVIGATFSNPSGSAVGGTINGTFKDCIFTGSNGLRNCYAGETVVFENCVFSGDVYGAHFDGGANDIIFKNCTFSGFNAFAAAVSKITFENCVFESNGKSGYNGANLWGSATMIGCRFVFDGSAHTEWIDCIGTDKIYEFNDCVVSNGSDEVSIDKDDHIWSRNDVIVTIDGVKFDTGPGLFIDDNGYYLISDADELFKFAEAVNEGGNKFSGKTVVLIEDIDLEKKDWKPIGQTGATEFKGTFDGQNHTISNLYVDSSAQTSEHYSSGLFGWAESGATIKNVKVDGATIKGNHNVAVIVGYTYSSKITNCHVSNADIVCNHANDDACGDKCGIIVGYAGDESRISGCSAEKCTVTAGRDAGELVGCGYNVSMSGCSALDVVVTATGDCSKEANINNALIGRVMG
ncbi:MAG: leucine-rich repeat domain-containing protein [Candidatus Methanomethylophilaceae archaeon]|nr:leucine-rich repeat domain-containing protein [Candidatus Methanomethylophilaceae archaeon]